MVEKKNTMTQFLQFGVVGVINTLMHAIIANIAIRFGVDRVVAQGIGYLISSVNGYLMNKIFVFEKKEKDKTMIVRYYMAYAMSFLLTIALSYFYVNILNIQTEYLIFNIPVDILSFLTLIVTVPLNFCLSRFWIYK